MDKSKLLLKAVVISCLAGLAIPALADDYCDSSDLHCAYATGPAHANKFIKLKLEQTALESPASCWSVDNESFVIQAEDLDDLKNKGIDISTLTTDIIQCADEQCSSSKLLAVDKLHVTTVKGDYVIKDDNGKPKPLFTFNLDGQFGVDCPPDRMKRLKLR